MMRRCYWIMILSADLAVSAPAQPAISTVYQDVKIDQNLNGQIPLDLKFRDEKGDTVKLADYFGSRPVVLSLVYYNCPMLCTEVLNGMVQGFKGLPFTPGREFNVVTVSIDPRETPDIAAQKKDSYLRSLGRPGAGSGWHFLTGDETSIRRLADAVGFHYLYDPNSGQFAHATGIMVATPEGRLSRYLLGLEYSPEDLRFSLMEASRNRIGTIIDRLVMLCYHYDPMTGKYGLVIVNVFRIGGAVTVVLLGWAILLMLRRERRKALHPVTR